MHISLVNYVVITSVNALSTVQYKVIFLTQDGMLWIAQLGAKWSEIVAKTWSFKSNNLHFAMSKEI